MDHHLANIKLQHTLETLKMAVEVSETAPKEDHKGYPYATGYSRSAMQSAISDIEYVLKMLQEEWEIPF